MDNKGWGLPEMLILSAIIIFALMIAVINIKKLGNNIEANSSKITKEENVITSNEEGPTSDEPDSSLQTDIKNNDSYVDIENKMIKASQQYIEQNFTIEDNITIIVDESHLIEQDSTLSDDMSKDNCGGYVKVTNDNINFYYTPYLKCDNYVSDGYNNSYE